MWCSTSGSTADTLPGVGVARRPRLLHHCHRPAHRHDHRLHGGSFTTSTTRIRTYTDPSVLVIDDVGITHRPGRPNAILFEVVGEAAARVCHSFRDLPLAHAGFRRRRGQAGAKRVGSLAVGVEADPSGVGLDQPAHRRRRQPAPAARGRGVRGDRRGGRPGPTRCERSASTHPVTTRGR